MTPAETEILALAESFGLYSSNGWTLPVLAPTLLKFAAACEDRGLERILDEAADYVGCRLMLGTTLPVEKICEWTAAIRALKTGDKE